jgi:homoserine kinase type II
MAALTELSKEDARGLFEGFDDPRPDDISDIEPVLSGTVNSSYGVYAGRGRGRLFVRIYEEQDHAGAAAEAGRLELLAARGVRTPAPLRRADGSFVGTVRGKPAVVFPWREGEMRCLARVTAPDATRVGVALAELHLAGRDIPASVGRFEPADLEERLDRLAAAPFPAITREVPRLREKLQACAARRDPALPRGFVHGDVFRDNVLWDTEGEISALLDFESASLGVLAYDLMVTILAWSFRETFDEAIARALLSGYESVRPLEPAEKEGLLAEGCVAAIRFTITRLTDSELRAAIGGVAPRKDKDYRRFMMRLSTLESLGDDGLRSLFDDQRWNSPRDALHTSG